ncbi:phosphotransferase-like protein [Aureococcus anophagefferens]|nr:phosphotransferase-like protein [Aureococcus anophagefferens]
MIMLAMAQQNMDADIRLADASASDIRHGLDGAPHARVLEALRALGPVADGASVAATTVADELKQPNSHSAVLRLELSDGAAREVFVKKVTARHLAHKPWADRRRSLAYARCELRFYREFAPGLDVGTPRVALLEDAGLEDLGDAEPPAAALETCGAVMWLETVRGGFEQAAWEDEAVLGRAAERLQRHGSLALSIRNPKELERLEANWATFKANFAAVAPPGFFDAPGVADLGRLKRARVRSDERRRWRRVRVPRPRRSEGHERLLPTGDGERALLIDFASTGVGYGMADVAMHLAHAVFPLPADVEDGLIDGYLAALDAYGIDGTEGSPYYYTRGAARHHYRLGVVDYARFVVGRFWGAASPETFAAKAANRNVALVHRNVDAALAFVAKVDAYLRLVEADIASPPKPPPRGPPKVKP